MSKKEKIKESNFTGVVASLLLSVLFIVVGAAMLFLPDMKLIYFSFLVSGILLASGIALIVSFFVKKGFRDLTNYNFSTGTLVTIVGFCILVRAKDLTEFFYVLMGTLLLVFSVILLQYAIQMKGMAAKRWGIMLLLALIFMVLSVLILTDVKKLFSTNLTALYIVIFVAGILGILSVIFVALRSRGYKKEQDRKQEDTYSEMEALSTAQTTSDTSLGGKENAAGEGNLTEKGNSTVEENTSAEGNASGTGNDDVTESVSVTASSQETV